MCTGMTCTGMHTLPFLDALIFSFHCFRQIADGSLFLTLVYVKERKKYLHEFYGKLPDLYE